MLLWILNSSSRVLAIITILFLLLSSVFAQEQNGDRLVGQKNPLVLALKTQAGWVHDSNAQAVSLLEKHAMARNWGLSVADSVDNYFLNIEHLRPFDVIVFLVTSGSIFTERHQKTFRQYVDEGGSVVGVHSAIDTNRDWPFYLELMGAEFVGHPEVQEGRVLTINGAHSTTSFLPQNWTIREEFYNFAQPLRLDDKYVLLSIDETSYQGGTHGATHPISWTRQHLPAGSKIWVTVLGHTSEVYSNGELSSVYFQQHLALGIEWAANGTAEARQRWKEMQRDLAT